MSRVYAGRFATSSAGPSAKVEGTEVAAGADQLPGPRRSVTLRRIMEQGPFLGPSPGGRW